MSEKKKSLIVIILFMAMLVLPFSSYSFVKAYVDTSNYENRTLNEKPELNLETLENYPSLYEDYYNDYLPYKNQFNKLNAYINYKVFHYLDSDSVILGKDNWLFYKGEDGISINDYQAKNLYTETELENILNNVQELDDWCSQNGIDFVLMLIPNKENIYSEYMPDYINVYSEIKNIDLVVNYIRENSDIKVCYPKDEILELKETYQTYYKYDTHWNTIGAYAGYKALSKYLDYDYEELNDLLIEDIEYTTGDLTKLSYLNNVLPVSNEKLLTNQNSNIELVYEEGEGNYTIKRYLSDSKNNSNLYFVGDSFRINLQPFLSSVYEKSTFIHRNSLNWDDVLEQDTDILVYELVERYTNILQSDIILID